MSDTRREFRYRVKLERGEHVIEATDEHDARMQTLQMLAEDPSLIVVERIPDESELPTADEIQGILRGT